MSGVSYGTQSSAETRPRDCRPTKWRVAELTVGERLRSSVEKSLEMKIGDVQLGPSFVQSIGQVKGLFRGTLVRLIFVGGVIRVLMIQCDNVSA